MHIPRIYIDEQLIINHPVCLTKEASHHLQNVLRCRLNEPIILFNGKGGEYHGRIHELTKNCVTIFLDSFQEKNTCSPLALHLGQALTRNEKMDLILQKATELGVSTITPLITEYVNFRLDTKRIENRLEHWKKIIINACEQSGQTSLPEIYPPTLLSSWLKLTADEQGFILSPNASSSLHSTLLQSSQIKILIGPEGGLSDKEHQQALAQNFCPVRLGPRILRTETAGLAVITVLPFLAGDLN